MLPQLTINSTLCISLCIPNQRCFSAFGISEIQFAIKRLWDTLLKQLVKLNFPAATINKPKCFFSRDISYLTNNDGFLFPKLGNAIIFANFVISFFVCGREKIKTKLQRSLFSLGLCSDFWPNLFPFKVSNLFTLTKWTLRHF